MQFKQEYELCKMQDCAIGRDEIHSNNTNNMLKLYSDIKWQKTLVL